MAIYDFKCSECKHVDEVQVPISKYDDVLECPKCHKQAFSRIKDIGKPLVVFGCAGFYRTDNGKSRYL